MKFDEENREPVTLVKSLTNPNKSAMSARLLFLFLCCACRLSAQEVVVVLSQATIAKVPAEGATKIFKQQIAKTAFNVDFRSGHAAKSEAKYGKTIPPTDNYSIRVHRLHVGEHSLQVADEILAQGSIEGSVIAITRRTFTSANPKYWLLALSGHPAQFSEIIATSTTADGRSTTINLTDQIAQSSAATWSAALFQHGADPKR